MNRLAIDDAGCAQGHFSDSPDGFSSVCDHDSKKDYLRWHETADVPIVPGWTTHQHPLRAIYAMICNLDNIVRALANLLHPLLDRELTLAIYDLTTVRIHGKGGGQGGYSLARE